MSLLLLLYSELTIIEIKRSKPAIVNRVVYSVADSFVSYLDPRGEQRFNWSVPQQDRKELPVRSFGLNYGSTAPDYIVSFFPSSLTSPSFNA